jgi:hypothetical protein
MRRVGVGGWVGGCRVGGCPFPRLARAEEAPHTPIHSTKILCFFTGSELFKVWCVCAVCARVRVCVCVVDARYGTGLGAAQCGQAM